MLSASLRNAICKSHIVLIQLGLLERPSFNGMTGGRLESAWVSDLESCRNETTLERVPMLRLSIDRGDEASMRGSSGAAQASRRKTVARGPEEYVK